MIVDGFDYGDGFTKASNIDGYDIRVQFFSHRNVWVYRWSSPEEAKGSTNADLDDQLIYRRPMTDAEKQAEKAKEEKVKEDRVAIKSLLISEYGNTPSISLSEAVEISGMQCVADEKERQRKDREIKAGDWFWAYNRPRLCTGTTENHIYDKTLASEKSHCKKINDKSLLAMLEAGVTP